MVSGSLGQALLRIRARVLASSLQDGTQGLRGSGFGSLALSLDQKEPACTEQGLEALEAPEVLHTMQT